MTYEVLKPFKTINRKFAEADKITLSDLVDSAIPARALIDRKFIQVSQQQDQAANLPLGGDRKRPAPEPAAAD